MASRQRRVRSDWLTNRGRIVSAAARMFAERGVEVPLDEVAAAAGVGSATLHRHFTGRLDLVHTVLDTEAARLAAQADDLAARLDAAAALAAWLHRLVEFTSSFRGLAVLLGAHQADPTLEQRHRALYAAVQNLLDRGRAQGTIRGEVTGRDVLKLANAISITSAGSPQAARRLLDLMMNGLLHPQPPARPRGADR